MTELHDLYQQMILDHGRKPRNFCICDNANHTQEGYNPLCGDKIMLYLFENQGVVQNACFQGEGCAISTASASLMTEAVKGKTVSDVRELFDMFHAMIMGRGESDVLGKLAVLKGVSAYPMRVKCATLPWHTLIAALNGGGQPVTTET